MTIQQAQRLAGNRAVQRALTDSAPGGTLAGARLVIQRAAATWGTRAQAQATAAATRARIRGPLLQHMRASRRTIVRNTAELFSGSSPLLVLEPVTKRSDSAAQFASPTVPGWANPATHDAFFWGPTMTNVHFHQKGVIGTLSGNTMYVRGHDRSGTLQSLDDMSDTTVHECSHYLVAQYGELPRTSTAASFDRYADEFRAYWVEGSHAGATPAERARRIRRHLVGVRSDPNSGYPNLHRAYFAPAPNAFKTRVDAMTGPVGFNLGNSIRLHELWQLLTANAAGTSNVRQIVMAVANLRSAERDEAESSTLIQGMVRAMPAADGRRVTAALSAPTSAEYREGLNPTNSAAVRRFFGAIIDGGSAVIKHNYRSLPRADKVAISRNPSVLVFLDHHLLDSGRRAAVFGMLVTGLTAQFDAVVDLVAALRAARSEPDSATLPRALDEALSALRERARWVFFSWGRDGAMQDFVEPLPPRMERNVRERLRA